MEVNILLCIVLINSLTPCLKQVAKILSEIKKVTVRVPNITVTFNSKQ